MLPACRLFFKLYETDVILEEAFRVWRDDTSDETPGRDTALVQVEDFLQWLEEGDEEGDDLSDAGNRPLDTLSLIHI